MMTLPMWEMGKRMDMWLRLNTENETHSDQGLRWILLSEFERISKWHCRSSNKYLYS